MEQETVIRSKPADLWNERYSSYKTVYGHNPNEFFKENIVKFPAGKLLLPAEGEGRNGIFAAKLGWTVDAFDHSEVARSKALANAADNNVALHYITGDINEIILPAESYDAIALIYFHLDADTRKALHHQVIKSMKKGGHLILEAFSKDQLQNISGGPKDLHLLYDLEEIMDDFRGLNITLSRKERVRLNEGPFHQGKADVIRILASKPS